MLYYPCVSHRNAAMDSERASVLSLYRGMVRVRGWSRVCNTSLKKHYFMKTLRGGSESEMNGSQPLTRKRLLQLTPKIKQR